MQEPEHPGTTTKCHNVYSIKHLAGRGSILSAVLEGVAFACLIAVAFILLEAV